MFDLSSAVGTRPTFPQHNKTASCRPRRPVELGPELLLPPLPLPRPRWSTGCRTVATSARLATFGPVSRLSMSNGRVTAGSPSLPRDQKVPYCDSAHVWRSRFGPISPPALRLALLSPHNMESILGCGTNRIQLSPAAPGPMPVRDPASKCRAPSTVAQGRLLALSLSQGLPT